MKIKSKWSWGWHILFILLICMVLYPILFAVDNSMKTDEQVYAGVTGFLSNGISFHNYIEIYKKVPLLQIMLNTFAISTIHTFLTMLVSFLASYVLVYYRFKGSEKIVSLFVWSMFIPFTVTIIPHYLIVSKLQLVDTWMGVVIPQIFSGSAVFLLIQSMRNIPVSLIEVAKMENISDGKIMCHIVLPLVKPQLIATSIWFFALAWNDFIWPNRILKETTSYTLPLILQSFISGEGGGGFTSAMAMSVITMIIPLALYLIFQKYIIETFTSAGIK